MNTTEKYAVEEIKAKIASGDYGAELMLQHAMVALEDRPVITSESVAAWMRQQLAKAHELSDYGHIQVHCNGSKTYDLRPARFSVFCGEGYGSKEHHSIDECFDELKHNPRKSKAEMKREAAAKLLAEAEVLENQLG